MRRLDYKGRQYRGKHLHDDSSGRQFFSGASWPRWRINQSRTTRSGERELANGTVARVCSQRSAPPLSKGRFEA
jgi:hypothetical protein